MIDTTAAGVWAKLDGARTSLMKRVERYAALTLPKICLPPGFDQMATDQAHDYQSIGAQAVNHVTNKIMLALFAPSRPFFKLQPGKKTKKELDGAGIDEKQIAAILSKAEREAISTLDARGQRPRLYQMIRHLVVAGNVLLCGLDTEKLRVMGMRYFCVKRCADGRLHTLVIKERVKFDELDPAAAAEYKGAVGDAEVDHYRLIQLSTTGDYTMTQWINTQQLSEKFNGKWPEAKLPYRVLTWDLGDEADYATSLVEEYIGDFESMSVLSENVVNGAVLGTEFRWMVNPTGMTSATDLNNSQNGDALPGKKEDVDQVGGGNPQSVEMARELLKDFEQRISRGFLLNSAVTRDAERVTAEEIRMTAMELETAYGGVYSALAVTIQTPLAYWLLMAVDKDIQSKDLQVVIITGLDALSRSGDLENLRLALQDLAMMSQLPPDLQARLDMKLIAEFIGNGRGVDLAGFMLSEDKVKENMAQAAHGRVAEASATAAGEAQAQANAQPPAQ